MEVETIVAELLERVADVTELLGKAELTAEEEKKLQASAAEFGKLLQSAHASLDERIKQTLGDEVPLLNNSYKERDELEVGRKGREKRKGFCSVPEVSGCRFR